MPKSPLAHILGNDSTFSDFDAEAIYPDQELEAQTEVTDEDFREMLKLLACGFGKTHVSRKFGLHSSYLMNLKTNNNEKATPSVKARQAAIKIADDYVVDVAEHYLRKKMEEASFSDLHKFVMSRKKDEFVDQEDQPKQVDLDVNALLKLSIDDVHKAKE